MSVLCQRVPPWLTLGTVAGNLRPKARNQMFAKICRGFLLSTREAGKTHKVGNSI